MLSLTFIILFLSLFFRLRQHVRIKHGLDTSKKEDAKTYEELRDRAKSLLCPHLHSEEIDTHCAMDTTTGIEVRVFDMSTLILKCSQCSFP